jgi:DNA-binding Lrp family transcriptional regulator
VDGKKSVGNTRFQKRANDALILDILRRRGTLSRLDLAEATGLRQSTVTYIIGRLIARRIVKEAEASAVYGKRGQKPIPVAIDSSFGAVIGIDLCRAECRFAICDIVGKLLYSADYDGSGAVDFDGRFIDCYRHAAAKAKKLGLRVLAVGLSVSGVVDAPKGVIIRSWADQLSAYDVVKKFGPKIKLPIIVENDAKCCAYAKLWRETESPANASFLYLFLRESDGTPVPGSRQLPLSVGMSIVVNGAVYRGASGFAGEFRSVFPPHDGRGQLSISNEELAGFGKDERVRRAVMSEVLSNMVLLLIMLNPSVLYIGGDVPFDAAWLSGIIDGDLDLRAKFPQISECEIILSESARLDAALGACANVLSAIYSIPAIGERSRSADLCWDAIFESTER